MDCGAQLWGMWATKGYEFEDSKARVEDFFLGVGMDQEGQADATPGRVRRGSRRRWSISGFSEIIQAKHCSGARHRSPFLASEGTWN